MQVIRSLALSFSLLCACCSNGSPGVPAQVVGVTDGDTITAIVDGRQIKVRLNGIDAPEKKQAFGNASKHALSVLSFGQRVSIVLLGKDRWGTMIAEGLTGAGRRG